MSTYDNRIQHKALDQLGWTIYYTAAVADKFNISGASDASLNKSFKGIKDLPTQTALELDLLLSRFLKMESAFEPFILKYKDPDHAKTLLEDFEGGRLVVSVRREEPGALVYGVYLIENAVERNLLFKGIKNGEPSWGFPGAPINDRQVADAAANTLADMGHSCRVFSTSVRTTEEKIAKSMSDLGFITQEKEATNA